VPGLPARLLANGRAVKGKALHLGLHTSTSRPFMVKVIAVPEPLAVTKAPESSKPNWGPCGTSKSQAGEL